MSLWNSFRNYFYRKKLRKQLEALQVRRSVINLVDAQRVGILFDYYHPENEASIVHLAGEMRSAGKEVEALGYNRKKDTVPKEGIRLLNTSEVSWAKVPAGETAHYFAKQHFDLLLCCFIYPNAALEFIARTSHARWRVGVYSPDKTDCYDLMIHLEAGKDLSAMIEQTKKILNQIHYDSKQT